MSESRTSSNEDCATRGRVSTKRGKVEGRRQGIFWLLTIPHHHFVPFLPSGCVWITGQLERGDNNGNGDGFLHWQFVVAFAKKTSLGGVRSTFGSFHAELTYSSAAVDYCHKEATGILGTKFELGVKPIQRNSKTDWESVWTAATVGDLTIIPASIRVQSYRTLRSISTDFAKPLAIVREVYVYWGPTATGKSRSAWSEAGVDAYPKDPKSKFWCGYRDQEHVVIDEFRGDIDIAHLLRWLDRHPVIVEVKGGAQVFKAKKIWITSNLDPRRWYPTLDDLTNEALMRRLKITHFDGLSK